MIESRLRDRVFAHIQRLHFSFHDANATGDLMSRANTDLQNFQDVITMIPLTTGQFVLVAGAVIIMFLTQPALARVGPGNVAVGQRARSALRSEASPRNHGCAA